MIDTSIIKDNTNNELKFLNTEQINSLQNKSVMTKVITDNWQNQCPIGIYCFIDQNLQPVVCTNSNALYNSCRWSERYQLSIGTVDNLLAVYVKFNLVVNGRYDLRYSLTDSSPTQLIKHSFKLPHFTPLILKDLKPKAKKYCLSFIPQITDIILNIFKTQVDKQINEERKYLQNHLIDSWYDNYIKAPLLSTSDYLKWLSAPTDDKMFKNGRTAFLSDNIADFSQYIISHQNVDQILANSPNMINTLISIYLDKQNQTWDSSSVLLLNKVLNLVANKPRLLEEVNSKPLIHLVLCNGLTNVILPFTFLIQGKNGINKIVEWFDEYPNQTLQFKVMNETDIKGMINHIIDRHLKPDRLIELIESKQIKVDLNQQEKIIKKYLKLIKRDWADVHVFDYVTALLTALLTQK